MKSSATNGLVLDRWSSLMFGQITADDGFNDGAPEHWGALGEALRNGPTGRHLSEYKTDLLSSVLIGGQVHLLRPEIALDKFDLRRLENAGIAVSYYSPYSEDRLKYLDKLQHKVFHLARTLEADDRVSKVISLDKLVERRRPDLSDAHFGDLADEYRYYSDRMLSEMERIVDLSPELFDVFHGHYADSIATMKDSFGDIARVAGSMSYSANPIEMFQLMGLNIRDDISLRPHSELGIPEGLFPAVPPDYFRKYGDIDRMWGEWGSNDWEDQLGRVLGLWFGNSADFFRCHSFWRTWLEVHELIHVSSSAKSRIRLGRQSAQFAQHPLVESDDKVQLFRLYIRGVNRVPRIETVDDLVRLANHKYVQRFRNVLAEWSAAVGEGESNILERMKRDFDLATRDLSRVASLQQAGEAFTIIALPFAIAGLLTGLPLDFAFTAIGPAMVAASKFLEHRAEWVKFGNVG